MSERRERVANTGDGFAYEEPLLFERSQPGRQGYSLPSLDVPAVDAAALLPEGAVRDDLPGLPELSEVDVVRHFTRLSSWNASVDLGLYTLGSCGKGETNCGSLTLEGTGGKTTDFSHDIIFSNGSFVQWPEGKQE